MRALLPRVLPALLLILAIGLLVALWPARLGGAATSVSTNGSSMEPLLHQGDLVVVRAASTYRIGDVVAYRSHLLDTVVLHRIVAHEHGRYVMKGDNNSWLDAERPTSSDLIGRLWLRAPRGGALVRSWAPAIALGVGAALALGGSSAATSTRLRRRPGRTPMPTHHHPLRDPHTLRIAAMALAAIAVTSAVIAAYAWTRPPSVTATTAVPYTQRAEFSYTAPAPTAVYEGGHVETGDPVYLRTAGAVTITATYDFAADATHTVAGSIGLSAEVRDGAGWHHTLELAAPAPFDGAHAVRTGQLDLVRLQALLADVRAATGASSSSYVVDVVSNITTTGAVGGRPLQTTFTPAVEFQLDAVRLAPRTPGEGREATFATTADDRLELSRHITNRAELGWISVPVGTLRGISPVAAIAAGLAAGAAALALRRRLTGEAQRIALRHGRRVISVRAVELRSGVSVLEVPSITDLVRLADQHEALILHERAPGSDTYHFQVGQTRYRYVSGIDRTDYHYVGECVAHAHASA